MERSIRLLAGVDPLWWTKAIGRNKIFIVNAVEIKNVSKSYGDHLAVSNLDLSVPEGSVYGFIGPNGSGKTTTIRMILHIILPDTGTIDVMGKAGTRAAESPVKARRRASCDAAEHGL